MSMIANFLIRMYLATGMNPCELQRVALSDFDASGMCIYNPDLDDGECTEDADTVLHALWTACTGVVADED